MSSKPKMTGPVSLTVRYPTGAVRESTCCAKRPKRKKTARSYAALRRAAYYPLSLPPHCKGFHRLSSVCTAIMRHSSEIPANRGLTAFVNWSIDPEKRFRQNGCPRRSFGRTTFCFLLSDEKLLGRFWVLIRIATALCRLVATTL